MRLLIFSFAILATTVLAQENQAPPVPTWDAMIAQGILPYRQLTVEDIPIKDDGDQKYTFNIEPNISPRYSFLLTRASNGFFYAYVQGWMVFGGLDKNKTSRKKSFKTMKAELPYAQAFLDLAEIQSRRLGALKPGELPSARGKTSEEAVEELRRKIDAFLDPVYKQYQAEADAFAKATENGVNKKKVRELAGEIKKRLEATPATTVPYPEAKPAQASSVAPTATAATSATPGAPPASPTPAIQY
jgi:hypothetical protein